MSAYDRICPHVFFICKFAKSALQLIDTRFLDVAKMQFSNSVSYLLPDGVFSYAKLQRCKKCQSCKAFKIKGLGLIVKK
jgi:hypothetical protein